MYRLSQHVTEVKGIGPKRAERFAEKEIYTIKDLVLFLPLRYEDRSARASIAELEVGETTTIEAAIENPSQFYRGRKSIQSAKAVDSTGSIKLMWFNTPYIIQVLKKGNSFRIAGKKNEKGTIIHPTVERVEQDSIHTDRLVPVYSAIPDVKPGKHRRILKHVIDNLSDISDPLTASHTSLMELSETLKQLHFPDTAEKVREARSRLAVEELISLIRHSEIIKRQWKDTAQAPAVNVTEPLIPASIPFTLTAAQDTSLHEIIGDLDNTVAMNRLLVGDVGAGKTVVAGIAAWHVFQQGDVTAFVAPTQILAKQHGETLQELFPDMPIHVLTAADTDRTYLAEADGCIVGTHAILNELEAIDPTLLVFDEQHRFGVNQRSAILERRTRGESIPHILTMTATPIPRSLMLTIFSHLQVSTIDELPPGRIPTETWLVPEKKRESGYDWIRQQIESDPEATAFVVCPFINQSEEEAFQHVAAATDVFERLAERYADSDLKLELLHGKRSSAETQELQQRLNAGKIDILVTTPVIEVGLDVPSANIIVIESAERFGLASLHQLRGRVGRAGQESYCMLFTSHEKQSQSTRERLEVFTRENNGLKLAEYDLQRRGGGDLFGTEQSGFDQLQFADWANLKTIEVARTIYSKLKENDQIENWEPFIPIQFSDDTPIAN